MPPLPVTFDLLTLRVVSESLVTWATSVPILVSLGLSVLDLGPMCTTDRRQTDVRQHHFLMLPPRRRGIITVIECGSRCDISVNFTICAR